MSYDVQADAFLPLPEDKLREAPDKSLKGSEAHFRLLRPRYQPRVAGENDGVEGVVALQKQKVLRTLGISLVGVAVVKSRNTRTSALFRSVRMVRGELSWSELCRWKNVDLARSR
jgi:hypothetical protein